jgi:DNA-binding transcriptional LysR family regulator
MVRPHQEIVYNGTLSAKRLSRDLAQMKKVPLKLGIMSTISPDEIVELIAALRTRYDGLELKLCDTNARELRDRLLSGELEVAIYTLPGEQVDDQLHAVPLFRELCENLTGQEVYAAGQKPEGEINEVIGYLFPSPSWPTPALKNSFVTRIGDIYCGVGYYK